MAGAGAGDGGHLVAERLAAAGREQHRRVVAGHGGGDGFGLAEAELGVAEYFGQYASRVLDHSRSVHWGDASIWVCRVPWPVGAARVCRRCAPL